MEWMWLGLYVPAHELVHGTFFAVQALPELKEKIIKNIYNKHQRQKNRLALC
jgi:hypothetical protein